jgi:hypothetical protein
MIELQFAVGAAPGVCLEGPVSNLPAVTVLFWQVEKRNRNFNYLEQLI